MVSVPDWLLLTAQWVHLMGAVTWVGGSIFFKIVLQPAFRSADTAPGSMRAVGREFGKIVLVAIGILVVTGAFMAVVHLTAGGNSRVYIGILALKISLAFYMFLVVWLRRRAHATKPAGASASFRPGLRRALTSTTALLILGIVVIGLADVLSAVGGHGDGGHGHSGQAEAAEVDGEMDAGDASDDHQKVEEAVEEEVEAPETPAPTEEAKGGDDDHHEDEEADDDGEEEEDDDDDDYHDDGHSH